MDGPTTRICRMAATRLAAGLVLAAGLFSPAGPPAASAQAPASDRIVVAYEASREKALQPVAAMLKERRVLETFARMLSPLKLPQPLKVIAQDCEGEINAWFDGDTITLCYEYVSWVADVAGKRRRPAPTSDEAALMGPIIEVLLHEGSHALFDYLKTPILGREEDAADQMAALWLLSSGRTRTPELVAALVNLYLDEAGIKRMRQLRRPRLQVSRSAKLADAHSLPVQRMYNLVCLAYGADETLFDAIRKASGLPDDRAEGCADEYRQAVHAAERLIQPHVDADRARGVYGPDWPRLGGR